MRLGLKLAILNSGHSQRAVAAQTQIPEARLSNIVRGWTEPRADERAALQRCLHVNADAFASNSPSLTNRSGRR